MIIVSLIVTTVLAIVAVVATTVLGLGCIIAAMIGVRDRRGSIFDWTPRVWSKILLAASAVRVILHNPERAGDGQPHIFVSNHMSWFDIPTLASSLPRYKFVAKAELFRVPVFGPAIAAIGMVPMERQNRKAAFAAYERAAEKIRAGNSVVVFPEGTRGSDYRIRPFKKGPFVLAIAAGVPIIPVLVHGTREVMARGAFLVRPGRVDVHLLEPIATEGLQYGDRDALADTVRARLAEALEKHYGVVSDGTVVPELAEAD
ncbi:MAG TPA: lysophospholipid acyltransferase family protein [Gemmatimonadaceae bacterium]|nr:lysophospholipid acyltransferase family protein [Gemmatimonadaceae bacterium]